MHCICSKLMSDRFSSNQHLRAGLFQNTRVLQQRQKYSVVSIKNNNNVILEHRQSASLCWTLTVNSFSAQWCWRTRQVQVQTHRVCFFERKRKRIVPLWHDKLLKLENCWEKCQQETFDLIFRVQVEFSLKTVISAGTRGWVTSSASAAALRPLKLWRTHPWIHLHNLMLWGQTFFFQNPQKFIVNSSEDSEVSKDTKCVSLT